MLAYFLDAGLNFAHAFADAPTVRFQFLFARTAYADAPGSSARSACSSTSALAAEAGHRRALSRKPGQQIIQLRELDLQLAFAAARVARKNIQDKLRAVDYAPFRGVLDISLLNWRKIAVEDNQRSFVGRRLGANFVQFPTTYQRRGVGRVTHLKDGPGNFRTRAASQLDKFLQRFPSLFSHWHARESRHAFPAHTHKQRAFCCGNLLRNFRHELKS